MINTTPAFPATIPIFPAVDKLFLLLRGNCGPLLGATLPALASATSFSTSTFSFSSGLVSILAEGADFDEVSVSAAGVLGSDTALAKTAVPPKLEIIATTTASDTSLILMISPVAQSLPGSNAPLRGARANSLNCRYQEAAGRVRLRGTFNS